MKWHLHLSETDKHFMASLAYAVGVIILWRGIWGIADITPILENVFVSLFVGLVILTLTGFIYREFDPLESRTKRIHRLLHTAAEEAGKGKHYVIEFYDAIAKRRHSIPASWIHRVEEHMVILNHKGRELHVPFKRLLRVSLNGEPVWKQ